MTTTASSATTIATGFIGLLHLKKDAVIGLDGQTLSLKTDDFVGISGIDKGFHFVTVRAQPQASVSVGFVVASQEQVPLLVRAYDPQTEEVSSRPPDELTVTNLLDQVKSNRLPPSSVLDYAAVVLPTQVQIWRDQTQFITSTNILEMRGISCGDKLVPGSYNDESSGLQSQSSSIPHLVDGKQLEYPSIPVADPTLTRFSKRHAGTKRYLSSLSPQERTQLFVNNNVARILLNQVLTLYYNNSWEALLGDLQLAYTIFLHLQCLASLEHWKDLVAMLCLVDSTGISQHASLYRALIEHILPYQLSTMDKGFLEDIEEAGNNFLIPSLRQLCKNLSKTRQFFNEDEKLQFERLLSNKFPTMMIIDPDNDAENDLDDDDMDNHDIKGGDYMSDNDEDEDGPMVVDMQDVEAAWNRNEQATHIAKRPSRNVLSEIIQTSYPVLVAAIQPHEDILMTCARALDEKQDVSLVREAAAYLEEVERRSIKK